jgi:regulator of sigma E protease
VSLIPLGGYVRMAGDTPEENVAGSPDELLSKPKWQRFLILFAGPVMNIVIALAFMTGIAMVGFQQRVTEPVIRKVDAGKAGAKAGLQPGDRIISVKGEPVEDVDGVELVISMNAGTPLRLVYERNGALRETTLTPDRVEGDYSPFGHAFVDFGSAPVRTKLIKHSFVPALQYSVDHNRRMLKIAMSALGRLFRPEGSVKELSGPVNIARISGAMFREGWLPTIAFMAMISLQLGVMNLLPIPVLDGGHIMILIVEGIARRDLSLRVKERIQQAGFAVLATLMIVVVYNDVITNVLRLRNG